MPRSPETHAKIADVEAAEENLPWKEWIDEIMDHVELHEYRCPSSYKSTKPAQTASRAGYVGELSSSI